MLNHRNADNKETAEKRFKEASVELRCSQKVPVAVACIVDVSIFFSRLGACQLFRLWDMHRSLQPTKSCQTLRNEVCTTSLARRVYKPGDQEDPEVLGVVEVVPFSSRQAPFATFALLPGQHQQKQVLALM